VKNIIEIIKEEITNLPDLSQTKIVDDSGKPLIVYRTQKNERNQTIERQSDMRGIYFSSDKDSTKIYGNITKEYYLNIKNPLILKDKEWNLSVMPIWVYNKLISKGYDGAIWLRNGIMYEIIAFYENQIIPISNNVNEEIKNISSNYLYLQRCQAGEVNDVWDFRIVNGQNGEGIYAFFAGDKPMKDYYCSKGENLHSFKIEKKHVKDLSNLNLDYWDVKNFIYNNPQYKAFVFKHAGHGIPSSKEVLITDPQIIILDNSNIITEDYNHLNYLKWKRQNVTLRGVRGNVGTPNSEDEEGNFLTAFGDVLGRGLYTAALSNKGMAKQYGKVYYVLNAIPKHPMVFNTLNDWQIWFGNTLVNDYAKQRGANYPDKRIFNAETTIEKEMQKRGYDGIIIRGREMVNFTPPNNVLYFNNEQELINYFENNIENS
jgi:hypothetical protein